MRKTLPILLASLLAANAINAQITKGSVLLGGSISGFTQNIEPINNGSKSKGLLITPSVGFVTNDNNVVGLSLGYSGSKTDNFTSLSSSHSRFYTAGVFFRRYLNLGKKFYLFGEAGLGYSDLKTEQKPSFGESFKTKQAGGFLYLYPGVTYAVSRRFHLEASLNQLANINYQRTTTTRYFYGNETRETGNAFSFTSNVSSTSPLNIGFRFVL